jgi:hypothetical protein
MDTMKLIDLVRDVDSLEAQKRDIDQAIAIAYGDMLDYIVENRMFEFVKIDTVKIRRMARTR